MVPSNVLTILVLGGVAGMVGQGIRAVIGLKKAGYLQLETMDNAKVFNASYLILTLMIGFIAGVISIIIAGLDNFVNNIETDKLLAIVAAGYSGVDLIEGSFNSIIKRTVIPSTDIPQPPEPALTADLATHREFNLSFVPVAIDPLAHALQVVSEKRLNSDIWVPALNEAFTKFSFNTNRQKAAAIGQFMVEAGEDFHELTERLNYTLPGLMKTFGSHFKDETEAKLFLGDEVKLANRVYANRNGNGPESSGDGYRYRGRGLIQLTGKTEYQQFAKALNKPIEEVLAWCESPRGAAISGCWYLSTRGCLPLADRWELEHLTELVNGHAKVDLARRIKLSGAILEALNSGLPPQP